MILISIIGFFLIVWAIIGGIQTLIHVCYNFYWPGISTGPYNYRKKLSKKQRLFIHFFGGPFVWVLVPLIMVIKRINDYGIKKFNSWWEEAGDE